jgi:hypothetical protein
LRQGGFPPRFKRDVVYNVIPSRDNRSLSFDWVSLTTL